MLIQTCQRYFEFQFSFLENCFYIFKLPHAAFSSLYQWPCSSFHLLLWRWPVQLAVWQATLARGDAALVSKDALFFLIDTLLFSLYKWTLSELTDKQHKVKRTYSKHQRSFVTGREPVLGWVAIYSKANNCSWLIMVYVKCVVRGNNGLWGGRGVHHFLVCLW